MQKGIRTVCYDEELRLEAYCPEGVVQPFPHHFHEYYVVGLMEDGERNMTCNNRDYTLTKGDIVLFNPGDSHACAPREGKALFYSAVNITVERYSQPFESVIPECRAEVSLPAPSCTPTMPSASLWSSSASARP